MNEKLLRLINLATKGGDQSSLVLYDAIVELEKQFEAFLQNDAETKKELAQKVDKTLLTEELAKVEAELNKAQALVDTATPLHDAAKAQLPI